MDSNGDVGLDHRGWFVVEVQADGRGDAQRSAESDAWLVAGCDGMDKMGKQEMCACACVPTTTPDVGKVLAVLWGRHDCTSRTDTPVSLYCIREARDSTSFAQAESTDERGWQVATQAKGCTEERRLVAES
jgi:hypothetical protein